MFSVASESGAKRAALMSWENCGVEQFGCFVFLASSSGKYTKGLSI